MVPSLRLMAGMHLDGGRKLAALALAVPFAFAGYLVASQLLPAEVPPRHGLGLMLPVEACVLGLGVAVGARALRRGLLALSGTFWLAWMMFAWVVGLVVTLL